MVSISSCLSHLQLDNLRASLFNIIKYPAFPTNLPPSDFPYCPVSKPFLSLAHWKKIQLPFCCLFTPVFLFPWSFSLDSKLLSLDSHSFYLILIYYKSLLTKLLVPQLEIYFTCGTLPIFFLKLIPNTCLMKSFITSLIGGVLLTLHSSFWYLAQDLSKCHLHYNHFHVTYH